jgi:general secretion pathway protein A
VAAMYNSFFGFSENPFNLTPDPRYLFLSAYHKEAFEHLLYGINERKGFIVITGGIGTGKTTLCRTLLNHLGADVKSALIFNSFVSDIELLRSINQEFGIEMPPDAGTKKDYIDALNRFLLDIFTAGGNAVLIIDEAQNLSPDVLEQIRMLSNLETSKEKLIQIILAGQPELQGMLGAPSLAQLNERVMVRYDLRQLAFSDIRRYIEHRMVVAGGHGNVRFTEGAVRDIYTSSRGNPRRINNLCDRALLISYALGKHDVSRSIIKKSVKELYGDSNLINGFGLRLNRRALYAFLLLILLIVAVPGGWKYVGRMTVVTPSKDIKQISKNSDVQTDSPGMKNEKAALSLDEQKSLSILFSMFYGEKNMDRHDIEDANLELVSCKLTPEFYVMFKRPFRVSMKASTGALKYMVIKTSDQKGATAIDASGRDQVLDRDFIINNWGGRVSWVYANPVKASTLLMGVTAPEVLELQKMLNGLGRLVNETGVYDKVTYQEIMNFQREFGLESDGIAGPRTRALLYQMVR